MNKWLEEYVESAMNKQVYRNAIFEKNVGVNLCWNFLFIVLALCYIPTIL